MKKVYFIGLIFFSFQCRFNSTVKIGVIHSLSGVMASSESYLPYAYQIAADEINRKGGVLGKKIEIILADSNSKPETAAMLAEKMITQDHVSALFACWTSTCRKALKPVVEKYNSILFYPVQYEGLEESKNIFYTGSVPNQQIIPAIKWMNEFGFKRYFLIGSDYFFPRLANIITRDVIISNGHQITGEYYIPFNNKIGRNIIDEIVKNKSDIIINTINGEDNIEFFRAIDTLKINGNKIPVLSFSISDYELDLMKDISREGDYSVWGYFQILENKENQEFLKVLKKDYPSIKKISEPFLMAYISLKIWANAVNYTRSLNTNEIIDNIQYETMSSPSGPVAIDGQSHHLWKKVYLGRVNAQNHMEVVKFSNNLIKPVVFPVYKTKKEWGKIKAEIEYR